MKKLDKELFISLTSYPARINTLHITIDSLLKQTYKADKILLWLSDIQFPNKEKDLPETLIEQTKKGLEINWYHQEVDIKPYNKLINTLKKYPDSYIITADDDIIYNKNCVKSLVSTYIKNPTCIIANRVHGIRKESKKIVSYREWSKEVYETEPSFNLFLTGVGTVFYFPGCFHEDVLKEDLFMELCRNTDDIWFWAMAVLNKTKIKLAEPNYSKLNYVDFELEKSGLNVDNFMFGNNNDKNLQAIIKRYPQIMNNLEECHYLYRNKFEKMFSVKNNKKTCHKVITFCGLQIKIKSKKLIQQKQIKDQQTQFDYLNEQSKNLNQIKLLERENFYANVLRDSTYNSNWLIDKAFTLTGGAANYSFIFTLFKVLEDIEPLNILEFGLGQTSKVTTQYVINKNPHADLTIIEHDQDWINIFSKKLTLNEKTKIYQKNLIKTYINNTEIDKYDSLEDISNNKKFNLVIIDGPFGFDRVYPRTNILDLIPNNLANDFVIVLDDAERIGEQNTAKLIFEKLEQNNIEYVKSYKSGLKKQLLITSPNYKFIHWI